MQTGTKLGPYEVREQLGAGGMGEVWLADDMRLGRTVAIKVLPAEFAGDPERLARFEQEARAAAALNHPHIAAVYDVGHEDGIHFMVQEHLEGRSLRAAIAEGRLPLKTALKLAVEIAEGIGAAHVAGIVHRDLKPENVFVTPDGHAKILDFGLAKLTEIAAPGGDASASMSPTVLGTVAGQMMGTAGYMAPEQVDGVDVDHRADIFAFGALLYELVTGEQAFRGKNLVDTLHRVSNVDPDGLVTIDGSLPEQLQRILDKALTKDPSGRYQTAGDLAVDLRSLIGSVEAGSATPVALAADGRSGSSRALVAGAALAGLLLGALGAAMWAGPAPEAPVGITHFEVELLEDGAFFNGTYRPLAISPDGRKIAFADEGQVRLRFLGDPEVVALRGGEGGISPFFSHDSEWVAFCLDEALVKVPLAGGAPLRLAALDRCHVGATWGDDGWIRVGMQAGGALRIPEDGGEPELLFEVDDLEGIQGPSLLPGGEWLLFSRLDGTAGGTWNEAQVVIRSRETGEERLIVSGGFEPRYLDSGHITFYRDGVLLAVPFDLAEGAATGGAVTLLENISLGARGGAYYDVSRSGDLLYFQGGGTIGDGGFTLGWYDSDGNFEVLDFEPDDVWQMDLAPDGVRAAVAVRSGGQDSAIWIYELDRETRQRLTPSDVVAMDPIWSADGEWVYFLDNQRGGISRVRADFTGVLEPVTEELLQPAAMAPDGSTLVVMANQGGRDLRLLDLASGDLQDLAVGEAVQVVPAYSPDGRYLAFMSNQTGEFEIYVRDLESGRRYVASSDGGSWPNWAPDGQSLLYFDFGANAVRVPVQGGETLRFGEPGVEFQARARQAFPRSATRMARDGRVLVITNDARASAAATDSRIPRMQVILGWGQTLSDRVRPRSQ